MDHISMGSAVRAVKDKEFLKAAKTFLDYVKSL
jgi:hypothetical protein